MSQNTSKTPLQEIHIKIAEKQAAIVEQLASSSAYKTVRQNLKAEHELNAEKLLHANTEIKSLQESLASQELHIQHMVGYAKVQAKCNVEIDNKIKSTEQEITQIQQEHAQRNEKHRVFMDKIRDGFFPEDPDYAEAKRRAAANRELREKHEALREELAEETAKVEQKQAAQVQERNAKIVQFAETALRLKKYQEQQREYEAANAVYNKRKEQLMGLLANAVQAECVQPEEESQAQISPEVSFEKMLSQHQSMMESQNLESLQPVEKVPIEMVSLTPLRAEPQFKVPIMPTPTVNNTQLSQSIVKTPTATPKQKVDILQDIDLSHTPMDSHFFANKRKETQQGGAPKKQKSMDMDIDNFALSGDFDFGNMDTMEPFSFGAAKNKKDDNEANNGGFAGMGRQSTDSDGNAFSAFEW